MLPTATLNTTSTPVQNKPDKIIQAFRTKDANPASRVFNLLLCHRPVKSTPARIRTWDRRIRNAASPFSSALQKQLGKWNVASVLGGEDVPWIDNCVPLLHQPHEAPAASVRFVDDWILGRSAMPQMTDPLANVTRKSICEVLGNVFFHAESPIGAIAIGQIYPQRKMFQICVCDSGIGLVRRVKESGRNEFSPTDAIRWSLESGNSTMSGSTPHGLGLFVLREFIKVNGGVFRIYANNGCFNESSGVSGDRVMSSTLPGTLVDFRFNVRDDVTYTLAGT